MRKLILMFVVVTAIAFMFTSCKKDKEEVKTETEQVEEAKEGMASNDVLHQCPMDCEKGKSYTEAGKCPICKMDLKEKKVELHEDTEVEKDSTGM